MFGLAALSARIGYSSRENDQCYLQLTLYVIVSVLFTCAVTFNESFLSSNTIEGEAYYASKDYVYHQIKSVIEHHLLNLATLTMPTITAVDSPASAMIIAIISVVSSVIVLLQSF